MFKDSGLPEAAALLAGDASLEEIKKILNGKAAKVAENPIARNQLLGVLDMLWMTNLEDLEAL